jgi:hypothetical protein
MGRRLLLHVCAVMTLLVLPVHGQKIESYLNDMREGLVPYGTLTGANCHRMVIDLHQSGLWGAFATIDGTNPDKPGEPTGTILRFDVLQISVDLAALDEDNVRNLDLFSTDYVTKHEKGTPFVADTPAIWLHASGLNGKMTLQTIDLSKAHALSGQKNITWTDLGFAVVERKLAFIPFSDQQHADAFQKAIQKAIVLCKAQ